MVKALKQLDNHSFSITWTDGETELFKLSLLQRNCPCSQCRGAALQVEEDVKAFRVVSVGSYALRVEFSSGCSKGVYSFSMLRRLLREDV